MRSFGPLAIQPALCTCPNDYGDPVSEAHRALGPWGERNRVLISASSILDTRARARAPPCAQSCGDPKSDISPPSEALEAAPSPKRAGLLGPALEKY